jgi:hypothetical protein
MRLIIIASCTMLLSGCANDQYTVNSIGPGSTQRLASDLHDCKIDVLHRYTHSHATEVFVGAALGGIGGAAVGGGVAAGAASGAIAGTAVSVADTSGDQPIPTSQVNPMVEQCMLDKGYTGTSEN